jgi:glycosyltransferase involved in cell wall biosynthesis
MLPQPGRSTPSVLAEILEEIDIDRASIARHVVFQRLLPILAIATADERLVIDLAGLVRRIGDQEVRQPCALDKKSELALINRLHAGLSGDPAIQSIAIVFLLDVIGRGHNVALTEFAKIQAGSKAWDDRAIDYFCRLIATSRIFRHISAQCHELAVATLNNKLTEGELGYALNLLRFFGLSGEVDVNDREVTFAGIFLPLLRQICLQGDDIVAIYLETFIYQTHIKRTETPEHHAACWSQIAPVMYEMGKAMLARRAAPTQQCDVTTGPPKIAFFIHSTAILAHTDWVLTYLRAWHRTGRQLIQPIVFSMASGRSTPLQEALDRLDIPLIAGPELFPDLHPAQILVLAKQYFEKNGVGLAVFVSLPLHLAYSAGIHIAPRLAWWPMKFPLSTFPMVDSRIQTRTLYKATETIDGQEWRFGPPFHDVPDTASADEVRAIRQKYAGKVILGTIAREEKINSGGYVDAVVEILRRHPEACFLWTGRTELTAVVSAFEAAGVADRCHFVGWVDPRIYCGAFDVYLDTFPLSGTMAVEALHAGVAVVSQGEDGAYHYLAPDATGRLPYRDAEKAVLEQIFGELEAQLGDIWSASSAAYVTRASRLIVDVDLRRKLAAAGKAFVDRFLFNPDYAAAIFTQHFHEMATAKP